MITPTLDRLPTDVIALLAAATTNAVDAAEALCSIQTRAGEEEGPLRRSSECEARGDRITHDLRHALRQPLVADRDRAALLGLAEALDDVTDSITALALTPVVGISVDERAAVALLLRDVTRESRDAVRILEAGGESARFERLADEGRRLTRRSRAKALSGADPLVALRAGDWATSAERALAATRAATRAWQAVCLARG